MSVRGGPAQARLIPNSLLTKPLPGGAQVVMETERALGRENPPSFFFPSLPVPAMRVTKRTRDNSTTYRPPLPSQKIGERDSLPDFFLMGGAGGGHLYTGYTITIVYNVFRCGLMYHSTPNL